MPSHKSVGWSWGATAVQAFVLAVLLLSSPVSARTADVSPETSSHITPHITLRPQGEPEVVDGAAAFDETKYRAAVIKLKKAIRARPDDIAPKEALARLYIRVGRFAAAEKQFIDIRRLAPLSVEQKLLLGEVYRFQKKFKLLLRLTESTTEDEAPAGEILSLRGFAFLGMRKLEQATETFQQALNAFAAQSEQDPGRTVAPLLGLAEAAMQHKELDQAAEYVDRAYALTPQDPQVLLVRGRMLQVKGEYTQAIDYYRRSMAYRPTLTASLALAESLFALQEFDDVLAVTTDILLKSPALPQAVFLQASTLLVRGQQEEAYALVSPQLAAVKVHPPLLYLAALIEYRDKKSELALQNVIRFLRANRGSFRGQKLKAAILVQMGENDAALTLAEKLLALYPGDAQLASVKSAALMQLNRYEDATRVLEKLVDSNPGNSKSRLQLAISRMRSGQMDRAEQTLDALTFTDDGSPQAAQVLFASQYRRGEFVKALDTARAFKALSPEAPVGDHMIAMAYSGLGDMRRARGAYQRILKQTPDAEAPQLGLARLDMVEGQRGAAGRRYRAILARNPKSVPSRKGLAQLALSDNKPAQAYAQLKAAVDHNPLSIPAHNMLLGFLWSKPQGIADPIHEAVKVAKEFSTRLPDEPVVWELLARSEFQAYNPGGGTRALRRLSSMLPKNLPLALEIARLLWRQGKHDLASEYYRIALGIDHQNPTAWHGLLRLALAQQQFDTANTIVIEADRQMPKATLPKLLQADLLQAERKPDEALTLLQSSWDKDHAAAYTRKQYYILRGQGQTKAARAALDKHLQQVPGDYDIHVLKAQDLLTAKMYEAARDAYEAALKLKGDDAVALNNLAWIYGKLSDDRALATAKQAFAAAPRNAAIADTYGWLLYRSGNSVQAVAALRRAYILSPGNPTIAYHLAKAELQGGEAERAKQLLTMPQLQDRAFEHYEDVQAALRGLGEHPDN